MSTPRPQMGASWSGRRPTEQLRHVRVLGQDYRVAVRVGTDPARTPLLMCNGIGASIEVLQPFVDALPAEFTVVRFDVPGVGGSPTPALPYTYVSLAWALGKVARLLGYEQVDVLGVSWGGGLAQQFAVQHPKRCRRLILVSTGTGAIMVPGHPKVLLKMTTPRRYRDPDYAWRIAGDLYGGRLREHSEETTALLQEHLRLGSRRGYCYQLIAIGGWTSLPLLPLIRQPTLVIAGTDDPIIPVSNAKLMAALIPNATMHLHDDGHLALLTSPELVIDPIREFLSTTS